MVFLWPLLLITVTFTNAMSTKGPLKVAIHWFRLNDLRLHDNPALVYSSEVADYCIPFFCFDNKTFGSDQRTPNGDIKCGPRRAKFVQESVDDLRRNLERAGSSLYVCQGDPTKEIGKLLDTLHRSSTGHKIKVVCQEEVVGEEIEQVRSVKSMLNSYQGSLQQIWGSTMYELDELPFSGDLSDMPDTFTPFRNKVEKKCQIPKPVPPPKLKLPPMQITKTPLPSLSELGYTAEDVTLAETYDDRSVMRFQGGETPALARVKDYIWEKDRLRVYFDTRNGMLGEGYSTKLSPWLAHGNVSPRYIAAECQRYEQERIANKSTYWVVFELLWRDYCKFFAYKHGDRIFFPHGTAGKPKRWSNFAKNLKAWKEGKTGYPLVDANMREMKASGFMSNRGRQNVASFLAVDLNHDWRCGGDYFESVLVSLPLRPLNSSTTTKPFQ